MSKAYRYFLGTCAKSDTPAPGSLAAKFASINQKNINEKLGRFSDDEGEEGDEGVEDEDEDEDDQEVENALSENQMFEGDVFGEGDMYGEGEFGGYNMYGEGDMFGEGEGDEELEEQLSMFNDDGSLVDDEDDGTHEDHKYDLTTIDKFGDDSELENDEEEEDEESEDSDGRPSRSHKKSKRARKEDTLVNPLENAFQKHFDTELTTAQLKFLNNTSPFTATTSKNVGLKTKNSKILPTANRDLQRVDAVCALGSSIDQFNPSTKNVEDEDDIPYTSLSDIQRISKNYIFYSDRPALGLSPLPEVPAATNPINVKVGDDTIKTTIPPLETSNIRPRLVTHWSNTGMFHPQVYETMKEHALAIEPVSQTVFEEGKKKALVKIAKRCRNFNGFGSPSQRLLYPLIASYTDVMYASPNPCMPLPSWGELQDVYLAHTINHIFLSRDRVITHNEALARKDAKIREEKLFARAEKLNEADRNAMLLMRETELIEQAKGKGKEAEEAQASLAVLKTIKNPRRIAKTNREKERLIDDQEFAKNLNPLNVGINLGEVEDEFAKYRDQGFNRPKVLIITPTKARAYETVLRLLHLLPEASKKKIFNLHQLHEQFGDLESEHIPKGQRPLDYKLMFTGNDDDCFKMGISVANNSIKLFSNILGSDIVIGSPLGLKMMVGSEADDSRDRKIDFLSSIEVCVWDHAHTFNMQNMEHLNDVMSVMNSLPQQTKDVDFSRVRNWYLDGNARFYRQTIVLAAHWSSSLLSLYHKYSENFNGRLRIRPAEYSPVLRFVRPKVKHMFMRLDGLGSHVEAANNKFDTWNNDIWPKIKDSNNEGHVLIFIPSYLDFVRIRNNFRKKFFRHGLLCEFSEPSNVAAVRNEFFSGKAKFVLVTERFHYFQRTPIRGVRHVVWYGLPSNPQYYFDMLNYIDGSGNSAKCVKPPSSFVIYSKHDAMQLERIVGSEQCVDMLTAKQNIHVVEQ